MKLWRRRSALLLAGLMATSLLLAPAAAAAGSDHSVTYSGTTLHSSNDSKGFDISWVEQSTGRYLLADRTNAAVDWFDLTGGVSADAFATFLGKGQFIGNGPAVCAVPHACGGPNGVLTDKQHRVWAGDGNSSIKMIDPHVSQSVAVNLSTGGKLRADEEAYDPQGQVIEIANDAEGFLTFVSTVPGSEKVLTHFYYADNTVTQPASKAGLSTTGNGIEQPVWDDHTGLFYQAIPANCTGASCTPNTVGRVDLFKPDGTYVRSFTAPGCDNGPTGLVLARNRTLVGACGNGGVVLNINTGDVRTIIPNVGGADELWFNPGDGNVYFARSGPGMLGIADAESDHFIANLPTQGGSHSVAAYVGRPNQILVPLNGTTLTGIKAFISGQSDQ